MIREYSGQNVQPDPEYSVQSDLGLIRIVNVGYYFILRDFFPFKSKR